MPEITAGAVSLDLVIKDTLDKQLDGIKSRIESALSKVSETSANKAAAATDNAAKAAEDSVKKAEKAVEQADNGISKAVAECMARYEKQYKEMTDSVSKAAASIKPQTVEIHYNSDYDPSKVDAEVNEITKGIEDKLNGVKKESKEVFEGFQIPESAVERLQAQLGIIGEKTEELQNKYKELQMALSNTNDDDVAAKIVKEMGDVEAKLISLADRADKTKEKINAALNDDGEPEVAESIKKVEKSANKASSSIKNRFGSAFRSAKNISQKALTSVKERIKSVGDSANAVTKPIDSLFKRIMNGARRIFVMAGILSVLKSMRSALGEAANSNKQFSDSLESIKFNLAVAFQPIITAVMPMLNTLMSGIANVTQKIAAFTSALFGKTYQQSAKAVAKSKQAAAAAKKAGKEAKAASKYLADFDEMRVHQEQNSGSDSSSSASGAEQSTDYSKYTEKDIKLPDWAQKFKDAIKEGNWASVGSLLADKVSGAFGKIKWDEIKGKVKEKAKGLSDGINGFTEGMKWDELGNTIGEGINTAFTGAYTFLTNTKWKEIGEGLGSTLNGIINKTSFTLVGKTLGAKLNAIVGFAFGFVSKFNFEKAGLGLANLVNGWITETDWDQLGNFLGTSIEGIIDAASAFVANLNFVDAAKSITTALNNTLNKIDTGKLGKTVSDAFKGVWDFIGTALEKINWKNVGNKISDFINGIDWWGVLKKMFEVIGKVLKAAPQFLLGVVQKLDFGNAAGMFALLFAPKLASKLLKKITGDKGVIGTLKDAGGKITEKIVGGLSSAISTLKDKITGVGSKIASKIQGGANGKGLGSTFAGKFAAGATAFFVGWKIGSWLYDKFKDKFDWVGEKLGKVFARGVTEEAEKAAAKAAASMSKSNEKAKKFEKKGYKIDWTNEDTISKSLAKAVAAESEKNRKAKKPQLISTNNTTGTAANGIAQQKVHESIMADARKKARSLVGQFAPSSAVETTAKDLYNSDPRRAKNGLPKLARGGIVKAPTLALVGDNQDVKTNPEVVAPLAQLEKLTGSSDMIKYLQQIITILQTMQFAFDCEIDGESLLRAVAKQNRRHKAKTGASAI
jgi:hypothetical protein